MDIGLIGVEEAVAELSERELFTKTCRQFLKTLPFPTVLLETCQRTELYFASADLPHALHLLSRSLGHLHFPIYAKGGQECFFHLACVTSGLHSALVGESDIQRQVKQAYATAAPLTAELHFLFQKSLKVGKAVRSAFFLSGSAHSLEKVVFEQASKHMTALQSAPVLFIGNSLTNRKILIYFQKRGIANLTLCTRSEAAASAFCRHHQVRLMGWDQLASSHHFEGVIVATHTAEPLLLPRHFPAWGRTQFICDLSVPRAASPKLKKHPSLHVYDMDQMTALLRQKEQMGPRKLQKAQAYVNGAVEKQIGIFNTKKKRVVVCA